MTQPADLPSQIRDLDQRAAAIEAICRVKLVEAYVRLVDLTTDAVDTLAYQVVAGKHEETKIAAAREILDRAGLTPDIHVTVSDTAQSSHEVRLEQLRRELRAMQEGLTTPIDVDEVG